MGIVNCLTVLEEVPLNVKYNTLQYKLLQTQKHKKNTFLTAYIRFSTTMLSSSTRIKNEPIYANHRTPHR